MRQLLDKFKTVRAALARHPSIDDAPLGDEVQPRQPRQVKGKERDSGSQDLTRAPGAPCIDVQRQATHCMTIEPASSLCGGSSGSSSTRGRCSTCTRGRKTAARIPRPSRERGEDGGGRGKAEGRRKTRQRERERERDGADSTACQGDRPTDRRTDGHAGIEKHDGRAQETKGSELRTEQER